MIKGNLAGPAAPADDGFAGLGLLLWSGALLAQAQTYQQVAPNQPPAKGNGQIVSQIPAAEKARRRRAGRDRLGGQAQGRFFREQGE